MYNIIYRQLLIMNSEHRVQATEDDFQYVKMMHVMSVCSMRWLPRTQLHVRPVNSDDNRDSAG